MSDVQSTTLCTVPTLTLILDLGKKGSFYLLVTGVSQSFCKYTCTKETVAH